MPLEFAAIKLLIRSGQLHRLTRSERGKLAYEEHKRKISQHWATMADYLLSSKFCLPTTAGPDGKLRADRNHHTKRETLLLVPNDFPYDLETDCRHYVLWKLDGSVALADVDDAVQQLQRLYRMVDYAHWINPGALKSVREIDHAHIVFAVESEEADAVPASAAATTTTEAATAAPAIAAAAVEAEIEGRDSTNDTALERRWNADAGAVDGSPVDMQGHGAR
jgi:hypothetical protein